MSKITIDRAVVEQALGALDALTDRVDGTGFANTDEFDRALDAIDALRAALDQPQGELESIEKYRMQMAAISTAALGYWKDGDSIHPDYDTLALRDVAKLYANYDELYKAQPQVEQESVAWQSIEAMAVQRYKVVPAHDSMFYRHAVVAGDGTQQLYIGRETECENIARKFAGAFLDGAYMALLYTHPQTPRQPLTDEQISDLWIKHARSGAYIHAFVQAIERTHGIGGEA